jgi:hypothetical protein
MIKFNIKNKRNKYLETEEERVHKKSVASLFPLLLGARLPHQHD